MQSKQVKYHSPEDSEVNRQCYVCDKYFITIDRLTEHMQIKHGHYLLEEDEMGGKAKKPKDNMFLVKNFDDLFQSETENKSKGKDGTKRIKKRKVF